MKKYALALLLLTGSQWSYAQTVQLGLKAGGTFSRFVGADVSAYNTYRFGFSAGALAEIGLGAHWAVQPELLYSTKGSKVIDVTGAETFYQHLGYLEVPLLLKYKTHHVVFEAGPQAGLLLGATGTLESGANVREEGDKELFRPFDAGYVLGVGLQDTNGLLLGVRYNGGLVNVYLDGSRARNNTFQLYLGYLFGSHAR